MYLYKALFFAADISMCINTNTHKCTSKTPQKKETKSMNLGAKCI